MPMGGFELAGQEAEGIGLVVGAGKAKTADQEFMRLFADARVRVSAMEMRYVEITDDHTQAIFEIYAVMVLSTQYNVFSNH